MAREEQHDVVIVGGGLCGLATALALHRKGIQALVLEKSDSLRAAGAALGTYINGWRAIDQLGVGDELRAKAIPTFEMRDTQLNKSGVLVTDCRDVSLRCMRRSDLIKALGNSLPKSSVRFRSNVAAIETDLVTSFPVVRLDDGSAIKAKILIGCDGSNSIVSKALGLAEPRLFPGHGVQGMTHFPNGHTYGNNAVRLSGGRFIFGRIPVDDNTIYWFAGWGAHLKESEAIKDPQLIKEMTLEKVKHFPSDVTDMVKDSDLDSLSLTHIRYRTPWSIFFGKPWSGTTTVAGDAYHVMGPFIGQGGACGLEDSIVLARCIAREVPLGSKYEMSDEEIKKRTAIALSQYVKERRLRVIRLSVQSYIVGAMMMAATTMKRTVCFALLLLFGGMSTSHTRYDCGPL